MYSLFFVVCIPTGRYIWMGGFGWEGLDVYGRFG